MSFIQSVRVCLLQKYMTFSGRACRSEFWWFHLFYFFFLSPFAMIAQYVPAMRPGMLFIQFCFFLPILAVSVRRLHDTGRGWPWLLVSLIPVLGLATLLFFFVLPGDSGANRYGLPETRRASC